MWFSTEEELSLMKKISNELKKGVVFPCLLSFIYVKTCPIRSTACFKFLKQRAKAYVYRDKLEATHQEFSREAVESILKAVHCIKFFPKDFLETKR